MIMRVRRAVKEDLPLLARIEKEFSDNTWTEAQLREELESSHAFLFCCELNGRVIGFCDVHVVADDAHINELCIEPTSRRQGAAHAMMRHAIGLCDALGCSVLSLEVRSKNEPAIALYEKCGFEQVGIRKRFYQNPADDALNMNLYFNHGGKEK